MISRIKENPRPCKPQQYGRGCGGSISLPPPTPTTAHMWPLLPHVLLETTSIDTWVLVSFHKTAIHIIAIFLNIFPPIFSNTQQSWKNFTGKACVPAPGLHHNHVTTLALSRLCLSRHESTFLLVQLAILYTPL